MAKTIYNDQIKVLAKLIDSGYKTEKDISAMPIDKMLAIPNITVNELSLISDLQKAIKSNKVIGFLGGAKSEQEQYKENEQWR